jgi:hypothetical protein
MERVAHFDPDVLDAMLSVSDTFNATANRYQDSSNEQSQTFAINSQLRFCTADLG